MVIPQVLEVFFKGCKNFGVDEVVLCVVQDKVGHPGLFIAFQSDGFSGLFSVFSGMCFCNLGSFGPPGFSGYDLPELSRFNGLCGIENLCVKFLAQGGELLLYLCIGESFCNRNGPEWPVHSKLHACFYVSRLCNTLLDYLHGLVDLNGEYIHKVKDSCRFCLRNLCMPVFPYVEAASGFQPKFP